MKLVLSILVLAGGIAGFVVLVKTRPELTPSAPQERVWVVAAETVEFRDVQPDLRLFGEIVAGRQVELRALVAGEVVEVAPTFREGGAVEQGDLLLAIDPFDYQAGLDERAAQLDEAKARLDEIAARHASEKAALKREREVLGLRERELKRAKRLFKAGNVSEKTLDQARLELSRQRQAVTTREHGLAAQTAMTRQQEAAIARLQVALRRARRDLENTRLIAPFSGHLANTAAEVGRRVGVNDRVAELIEAGRLEVRVHLSDAQYGRILAAEGKLRGRRATVRWRSGDGAGLAYEAVVERTGARVDPTTGGIDLYARILLAEQAAPLRPGTFVEVHLPDRVYQAVVRLPESALFDGDTVYVVEAGRLARRRVELAGRDGEAVLLQGELTAGERIIVTRFAEIGPGVKVEVR